MSRQAFRGRVLGLVGLFGMCLALVCASPYSARVHAAASSGASRTSPPRDSSRDRPLTDDHEKLVAHSSVGLRLFAADARALRAMQPETDLNPNVAVGDFGYGDTYLYRINNRYYPGAKVQGRTYITYGSLYLHYATVYTDMYLNWGWLWRDGGVSDTTAGVSHIARARNCNEWYGSSDHTIAFLTPSGGSFGAEDYSSVYGNWCG